ncbi:MAG TPA: hypothetical protein VGB26_05465 [Nitrospiria bacterium]|jgi:hypothetical protein
MSRLTLEEFSGKEVSRIYIAGKLSEAKKVEAVFDRRGVDYAVAIEPYKKLNFFLFPTEYNGAFFYVLSGQLEYCKNLLIKEGLTLGLVDEGG